MNKFIVIGSIAIDPLRVKAIAADIYVGAAAAADKQKSVRIQYQDDTEYQAHGVDVKEASNLINEHMEKLFEEAKKSAEKIAEMFREKGINLNELIPKLKGAAGHTTLLNIIKNHFREMGNIKLADEIERRMVK